MNVETAIRGVHVHRSIHRSVQRGILRGVHRDVLRGIRHVEERIHGGVMLESSRNLIGTGGEESEAKDDVSHGLKVTQPTRCVY